MKNENSYNRRDFLKFSAAGSAGLALLGGTAQNVLSDGKTKKRKFIFRELGDTGIKLPIISMGVMRADNPGLVRGALDAGVVHFDTAHGYQGGRNEEMLGQVLPNYPRESYVLATKIYMDKTENGLFPEGSPERFYQMFHISLERLKIKYVDILYNHAINDRETALYEPIMNVMKQLQKEGKVKHLGISVHGKEAEVIQAAIDSKVYKIVLTSYNFKQDHKLELEKKMEAASKAGLGVIAMKTMAGGTIDGKKVNARAALKWALHNEHVHTAIPGFTSFEEMEEALSVMEGLKFNKEEKKDLLMSMSQQGIYCQGCRICMGQCPQNLPIPDLMRSYMYAYGYKDPAYAQETILSLSMPANPCGDCNICTVKCVKGFDVAGKIKSIIRVKDIPSEFLV